MFQTMISLFEQMADGSDAMLGAALTEFVPQGGPTKFRASVLIKCLRLAGFLKQDGALRSSLAAAVQILIPNGAEVLAGASLNPR
jgi:hypothetical protein